MENAAEASVTDTIHIRDDEPDLFNEEDQEENICGSGMPEDCTGAEQNRPLAEESMADDSEICPICFDSWTSSGPHRVCCLRCGHLFGRCCVLKWLHSQRTKAGSCPQCNARAQTKDVRVLFCKKIKAIDTTDLERSVQDLKAEKKLRRKTELELSEYKFKLQLASNDVDHLRDELTSLRAVVSALQSSKLIQSQSLSHGSAEHQTIKRMKRDVGGYTLVKTIALSPTGQCRVLASCDYISLLCISQPSTNPLFKGYGFRKVHTRELRPLKYIHLHSQPIRDLAFHPDRQDAIVASASLDKTLKLTSLLVDQVVQTYHCPSAVWSCCWASPSPHFLFAGCANGSILLFDIRVTARPVSTIQISEASSTPVTALQYLPADFNNPHCQTGGLLTGQLNQVNFLEESNQGGDVGVGDQHAYRPHPLPLEGSLVSLSSLPHDRLFLASYRPSSRVPRVRHLFAELSYHQRDDDEGGDGAFECNEVFSLFGGGQMRMLSRARLFRQAESNHVLAVSGDDDSGGAIVWNTQTGDRLQTISVANSATSPVIDVCPFDEGGRRLALLTDRQVNVYQWTTTTAG